MNSVSCMRFLLGGVSRTAFGQMGAVSRSIVATGFRHNAQSRTISILSCHRPQISAPVSLTPTSPSGAALVSAPGTPDLLPKISQHPGLAAQQLRCGPRDTYDPSQRIRKRRHGFLSRIRTRKGRATLKRRQLKGRNTLSH